MLLLALLKPSEIRIPIRPPDSIAFHPGYDIRVAPLIAHRANYEKTRFHEHIVTALSKREFNPSALFRIQRSWWIDTNMRVFVFKTLKGNLHPGLR